ncbi:MAG TPA: hypothetical protein VMI56_14435 [Reyranella sp.]|nr:hypothetical protein [Reyranella sp.]
MSNPLPYLVRMLLFLAAVAGLAYMLQADLLRVFMNTPTLDTVILGVLVLGIFFVFRQVIILWPEVNWLRRYQHRDSGAALPKANSANLLAPLAAMLGESPDQFRLSPTATRALLDGIATRLDERRELARYLIGLLIFLGLLGTFWGLLQTIGAVADAINSLQVSAGDAVSMFAKLKGSIEGPLKGMSTAFGASLFGLSGSLVLGFLELQASQAQGRFHIELEEWLARATSLSSANMPAAPNVPAYIEALLERNVESVDGLNRSLQRIEDSRQSTVAANATLVERLAALAETMRAQQNLLARFTELSIELRAAVQRLSDRAAVGDADRDALIAHQGRIEAHLDRLIEETIRGRAAKGGDSEAVLAAQRELGDKLQARIDDAIGKLGDAASGDALLSQQRETAEKVTKLAEDGARDRDKLLDELRGMMARVSDRAAAEADREAQKTHQKNVEGQLSKLAEDSERGRTQMADELKRAVGKLSDRSGFEADREALANLRRNIEDQLSRLVEENARNRVTLAEEMRAAVAKLAERFADVDRDAITAHQRNIEAHLARLVEDSALNRTALADELRGEMRLLARTIALGRGYEASGTPPAGSTPVAEG